MIGKTEWFAYQRRHIRAKQYHIHRGVFVDKMVRRKHLRIRISYENLVEKISISANFNDRAGPMHREIIYTWNTIAKSSHLSLNHDFEFIYKSHWHLSFFRYIFFLSFGAISKVWKTISLRPFGLLPVHQLIEKTENTVKPRKFDLRF